MTLRLFRCWNCGHRMRFSGGGCNNCHRRKKPYQSPVFHLSLIAAGGVVLLALNVSF